MLSPRSPFVTVAQGARARMPISVSSDEDNLVDGVAYADVVASAPIPQVPLGYQRHANWSGPWKPVAPDGASSALVRVEGGLARWRDDGQEPTEQIGMPFMEGESLTYDLATQSFWIIAAEPGVVVHVAFYGFPYESEGA